VLFTLLLIDM